MIVCVDCRSCEKGGLKSRLSEQERRRTVFHSKLGSKGNRQIRDIVIAGSPSKLSSSLRSSSTVVRRSPELADKLRS